MQAISNLHLKDLYNNTLTFISSSLRGEQQSESILAEGRASVPVASTPRDGTSLRERLDAVAGRPSACSCHSSPQKSLPLSSMRRELDVTKNELARSQLEVAKLQERCRILERTLTETKEILRTRDAELEKLKRDKEKDHNRILAERRRSDAESINGSIKNGRDIRKHQRNGSAGSHSGSHTSGSLTSSGSSLHRWASEDNMSHIVVMSEEERARRRSAEIFMTRTDSWSGAQILQAVHDLNSEILQFAASATEFCTFDKDSRPPTSRSVQAMHDTSARLGPNLARILSTRDHSQDPILVQLALQGCISACIARALSAFCIGFPSKSDTVLAQIFSHMCLAEPQPTSSKWRALTHRHIHMMYPSLADYAINELCETIFRWSSDIFIVAGCSSYENPTSLSRDGLRARFGDQVRRIAKSVARLARVTREEIMSTNFEIVGVDQGEVFTATTMSDAFGDYGASRGAILGTMELGLRCTTRKGIVEVSKAEEDVTLEQRLLLQPKVVLESVMDVLDPK
ncbi:hypothetical protein BD779DRAFT_1668224 [Infundibulicybe gibba]|nr:hypothetical protein BD779DRAFT_1668224 [Infundibulicybe gibba]